MSNFRRHVTTSSLLLNLVFIVYFCFVFLDSATSNGGRVSPATGNPATSADVEVDEPKSTEPPRSNRELSPALRQGGAPVATKSLAVSKVVAQARESSKPVLITECAAVVKDVVVDVNDGLFFPSYRGPVQLPFCSMASLKSTMLTYTNAAAASDLPLSDCKPLAVIGEISRPQHAFQFQFSLTSIVALQVDNSIDASVPVHFGVLGYGGLSTFTQFVDRQRYPHLDLVELLSTSSSSFFVDGAFGKQAVSMTELELKGYTRATPRRVCYKSAVYGGVALRIPRVRVQGPIRPAHFIEMRRRMITRYNLTVLDDPKDFYAIVVVRRKQKRRLVLNNDELVATIRRDVGVAVKEVDWEGMPLRDQLQLAINAFMVIGTHGNGHVWDCFMPQNSGMVELSSQLKRRNEVVEGRNAPNAGNIANLCGIQSISLRCPFAHNEYSKVAPPSRTWKELDLTVGEREMALIVKFLQEIKAQFRP